MDFKEPREKDVVAMAMAAKDAAFGKAKELGYSELSGMYGLARAWDACEGAMALMLALGPKKSAALADLLMKDEMNDMMKEAESVLEGDE